MRVPHRPLRAGSVAMLGLATVALTGALASAQTATAATSAVGPSLAAVLARAAQDVVYLDLPRAAAA